MRIKADKEASGGRVWMVGLVLFAMTVAAYMPVVVKGGFIWDDDLYLRDNPLVQSGSGLGAIWMSPERSPQYYPLVFTTFWVEYRMWGANAVGYHLINVLLHAGCVLLMWRVLLRLRAPGAFLAAALFAVHPVMVESVAWIAERKNVLSGVLYLGALLLYLRFAGAGEQGREVALRRRWGWYAISLVLFVLALFSKSVACSLPVAILLGLWYQRGRLKVQDIVGVLPFFVIGLAAGLYTAHLEKTHVGATGADWDFSLLQRVLIAGRSLWFYPWKLLVPTELTFIYPRWIIDTGAWWQYVYVAAAGIAIVMPVVLARKIGRGTAAAILFYVAAIFPALGFINIFPMRYSFVADHYQYLAAGGLFALAGGAIAGLSRRWPLQMRGAMMTLLVLVLMILTGLQCLIYHDATTLWTDTLNKNPDAWIAQANLGITDLGQGHIDEAVGRLERAYALDPNAQEVYVDLGNAYYVAGRYNDALKIFKAGLKVQGDNYTTAVMANTVGAIALKNGEPEMAMGYFNRAIDLRPTMSLPYANLARAELALGRRGAAEAHARKALELDASNQWGQIVLQRLREETQPATRP